MLNNITVKGYLYSFLAVTIWAGWMVYTRFGLSTSLNVADITALRFLTAGLLLLPVVIKKGFALDRLGIKGLLILVIGAGAPYALISANGLIYAPASHAAALMPGTMPLFVALISALFFGEKFKGAQLLGYGLILTGAISLIANKIYGNLSDGTIFYGHLYFLAGAVMWACFTVTMKKAKLEPLHATAIVAVLSMVFYLPVYAWSASTSLVNAELSDIICQAVYQGILSSIVALWLFGKGVTLLGSAKGASMAALVPIIAALLAIPVLSEWPTAIDWCAILLISSGVFLANQIGASTDKKMIKALT